MAIPEVSLHTATTSPLVPDKPEGTKRKEPSPYPPSDLMNLTATGVYLNRSRPWLYHAMREMGLPAIRLGRRWMCQKTKIDGWLASQPGVNLPTAI